MQPSSLFELLWPVDERGYSLEGTAQLVHPRGGGLRNYQPFQDADGLHREFANLELSPASVLVFAGRYGQYSNLGGDPLANWYREIDRMRGLVRVLENEGREYPDMFNARSDARARFLIRYDERGKPTIVAVPRNLLSAMYLMAAREVAAAIDYRRCEQCPKWYPVGAGTGNRIDKRFCSDLCRVAWHREHKKEAHR